MSPAGDPRPWRRLFRLDRRDPRRDLDDEFEFHLATRAAELEAEGVPAAAARTRAEAEFGDAARARAECAAIDVPHRRRVRLREFLDTVRLDVRYALRSLAGSGAFAAVAIVSLALGIGANTAIFSVVNGVLLRALPYPQPDRLVRLWETSPQGNPRNVVSPGNYADWGTRATTLGPLAAYQGPFGMTLTGAGEPERVMVSSVTASLGDVLRLPPRLGRRFTADDERTGERVALLSDAFWRARFGADPAVLGRTLVLDGAPYQVVGVMPPGYAFPSPQAQVWRVFPAGYYNASQRRSHSLLVIGRLRDGATLAQARSELTGLAAAITREWPQFMTGYGASVVPLLGDQVADVRPLLLVLFGGAAVVLLIACANIANLLLARAMAREREMAVRGALGAGRGRLVRQLLTESLVLAGAGGALGLGLAFLMLRGLLAAAPPDIPRLDTIRIEPMALGFVAAATVLCTMLFGLAPALRLARADLQATLRAAHDQAGGVRHARLRGALLVAEVALSLMLLVGAGLLLRSAQRLRAVDFGYRTANLLTVGLDLPGSGYDGIAARTAFYTQLLERLRERPGVAFVAGTSEPPASGFNMTFSWAIQGREPTNPSGREDPQPLRVVSPGYFRTLGIPVRAGRSFDARDGAGAPPVLVVNQALADRYFPAGDAVGARLSFDGAAGPWLEIVGVVGSTRMVGADQPPEPAVYMPYAQQRWEWMSWMTLMLRPAGSGDAAILVATVREVVRELDPQLALQAVATVDDLYAAGMARRRFATTLLGGFALLALVLGAIGMYGVVAYSVAQRRREIGIRMALGARAVHIVRDVMGQAGALAAAGIGIGTAGALLLSGVLRTLLYDIAPTDPVTFAAGAGLLVVVAVLAAGLPARRATRVDPVRAVRDS